MKGKLRLCLRWTAVAALCAVSLALPLNVDGKLVSLCLFIGVVVLVFVVCLVYEYAYDNMTAQLTGAGVNVNDLRGARTVAPTIVMPAAITPFSTSEGEPDMEDLFVQLPRDAWEEDDGWADEPASSWDDAAEGYVEGASPDDGADDFVGGASEEAPEGAVKETPEGAVAGVPREARQEAAGEVRQEASHHEGGADA